MARLTGGNPHQFLSGSPNLYQGESGGPTGHTPRKTPDSVSKKFEDLPHSYMGGGRLCQFF